MQAYTHEPALVPMVRETAHTHPLSLVCMQVVILHFVASLALGPAQFPLTSPPHPLITTDYLRCRESPCQEEAGTISQQDLVWSSKRGSGYKSKHSPMLFAGVQRPLRPK